MTSRLHVAIAVVALAMTTQLSAQSSSGTISGTVTDSSDASIANVTVTIKNNALIEHSGTNGGPW